jgi:NAD(P)-dependent dehydrogenase (short-subunit alcohol dehydrogenase family)
MSRQTAVVIGASRGIGREIAKRLTGRWDVVGVNLDALFYVRCCSRWSSPMEH